MLDLKELRSSVNIADKLDEEYLQRIGKQVIEGYEKDEESRAEWKDLCDKAIEIANQTLESKNTPWPDASNVKYPLITQMAIDFASRSLPMLTNMARTVKTTVIGNDPTGEKMERATRVSKVLSYQLTHPENGWLEELDGLLHVFPVVGTVFTKTYYDAINEKIITELCKPDKICVNYNTKNLQSARRITHLITFHTNDLVERMRAGIYREVDPDKLISSSQYLDDHTEIDPPCELLEQHCYLDLDGDGYQEPYVVIVHKDSGEVLRIVNRFKKVKKNKKGEVKRIIPEQFFVDYHFIRNPDGGFYSYGLGSLLYPLNAAINTLINQLIDSGTLNNNQSGFLGRGLRLKNGEFRMRLGEWKVLDAAAGTNIQQNVVPLPTKEPSPTLFQLLGLLIEVGKDLIAANDVMQGKQPAQNVATGTVATLVDQGMKVFNAISKRLHRALKKEFTKVYELQSKYLKDDEYRSILDDPAASVERDFNLSDLDILPASDPSLDSMTQRLTKIQAVMSLPGVNLREASRKFMETLQLSERDIEDLLPDQAPPGPEDIKMQAEIAKMQAETQVMNIEAQIMSEKQIIDTAKLNIQRDEALVRAEESAARIMKMKEDAMHNRTKMDNVAQKREHESLMKEIDAAHKKEKDDTELTIKAVDAMAKIGDTDNDQDRTE